MKAPIIEIPGAKRSGLSKKGNGVAGSFNETSVCLLKHVKMTF